MKTRLYTLFFTISLTLITHFVAAQGCSDAGFCTIDGFKPHQEDTLATAKNQFKIGMAYGGADNSISVVGNYLEYQRQLSKQIGMSIKLTSLAQSGNDISEFMLSDVFLNTHFQFSPKVNATLGVKIPLSDGNTTQDNLPLPMDYQASLGTFDLILGIGYKLEKWQFALALQQPLSQNDNAFLAENYPQDSPLRNFQSTNEFQRSGDALGRISYPITLNEKLRFTPSMLAIYHLTTDKYTDSAGVEQEIEGSEGLTLNGNVYFDYQISQKSAFQLNMAVPFLVRDTRPDGLTRSFLINLEYNIRF